MLNQIYTETEEKMKKAVEAVQKELASIRTGRATTALLDGIRVESRSYPSDRDPGFDGVVIGAHWEDTSPSRPFR